MAKPSLVEYSKHRRSGRACETCRFERRAEIDAARREGGSRIGPTTVRRWLVEVLEYKAEEIPSKDSLMNHFLARHHEQTKQTKPAKS